MTSSIRNTILSLAATISAISNSYAQTTTQESDISNSSNHTFNRNEGNVQKIGTIFSVACFIGVSIAAAYYVNRMQCIRERQDGQEEGYNLDRGAEIDLTLPMYDGSPEYDGYNNTPEGSRPATPEGPSPKYQAESIERNSLARNDNESAPKRSVSSAGGSVITTLAISGNSASL